MNRIAGSLAFFIGTMIAFGVVSSLMRTPAPAYDANLCAGPPLRKIEDREAAREAGYEIRHDHGCIDKASYEAVEAQKREWQERNAQRPTPAARSQAVRSSTRGFAQQRVGFTTAVALRDAGVRPLPQPPAHLFVRSDYRNGQNTSLAAFVTPDPKDGTKRPAILWLTGGDSNSLDDFWTARDAMNDQTARAFREAGVVMMFPTLRGSHGQGGAKEFMFGEVDDVLAAAAQLARLPYVDPQRIYLGGHSTGATLALLVAAMESPFKAVFAFGPASRADRYPPSIAAIDYARLDPLERKLRSPIDWLGDVGQTTFAIEGEQGNLGELDALCASSRNPNVKCVRVPDADHVSVLNGPVSRTVAARLMGGTPNDLILLPR